MKIKDLIKYEVFLEPNIRVNLNYTIYYFMLNIYTYELSKNIEIDQDSKSKYGLYDSDVRINGLGSNNCKTHLEDNLE